MFRVAVCGAAGKMGTQVVKAVSEADDMTLVAAVDLVRTGDDAGEVAGTGKIGVKIQRDLASALRSSAADVMVDFTVPTAIMDNAFTAINLGVSPVIGTTGLSGEDIKSIDAKCRDKGIGAIIAPNFAIGAVLMMKFASIAARYASNVEIIELHHDKKLDSPSGTAIKTAELMLPAENPDSQRPEGDQRRLPVSGERLAGARGAELGGIRIHSVRLPGLVAHQEVIFGMPGQTLTIRHDSLSRDSFMPGVLMAIRMVRGLVGATYGLEGLIE